MGGESANKGERTGEVSGGNHGQHLSEKVLSITTASNYSSLVAHVQHRIIL